MWGYACLYTYLHVYDSKVSVCICLTEHGSACVYAHFVCATPQICVSVWEWEWMCVCNRCVKMDWDPWTTGAEGLLSMHNGRCHNIERFRLWGAGPPVQLALTDKKLLEHQQHPEMECLGKTEPTTAIHSIQVPDTLNSTSDNNQVEIYTTHTACSQVNSSLAIALHTLQMTLCATNVWISP